jgi:hydroxyacylglutathione hydrolase
MTPALFPIPALNDNYIWIVHDTNNAIVVDPGVAEPVERYLDQHRLRLTAILLTHHHGDHVGGVKALHHASGAQVFGPATETLPLCHHRLAQGSTIQPPGLSLTFQVLDVPGHTAGHIAYYGLLADDQPVLFSGDTLFAGGCGRLFEGTPAQMVESLGKLTALPANTLVCCAHEYTLANLTWALHAEPDNKALQERFKQVSSQRAAGMCTLPSTVGLERETNPFCRTSNASVAKAAQTHAGEPLASAEQVFASLREWKNNF